MATIRIYTDDGRLVASYMDGNPEEAPIGAAAAYPADFAEALGSARADEGRDTETGERSAPPDGCTCATRAIGEGCPVCHRAGGAS